MYGVAGFNVNYPASTTNPILTPQPAAGGLGFGRLFSEAQFLQIAPTISYAISEKLSVGVAPHYHHVPALHGSPFHRATGRRSVHFRHGNPV